MQPAGAMRGVEHISLELTRCSAGAAFILENHPFETLSDTPLRIKAAEHMVDCLVRGVQVLGRFLVGDLNAIWAMQKLVSYFDTFLNRLHMGRFLT